MVGFFSHNYESNEIVASGTFTCPRCTRCAKFSHHRRTKKQLNLIFFIPVGGVTDVIGEYVECEACTARLDVSILLEAEHVQFTSQATASSLKNVVNLSERAAVEIRRRLDEGKFGPGVYVRLIPHRERNECEVRFDFPYADDEEWLGRSQGLPIVIDRALAERIMNFEVDFDGQRFLAR